jgi:predicted MPP superfamily phosphohydrolase
MSKHHIITRRDFLRCSSAAVAGTALLPSLSCRPRSTVRFGLVTDAHYADTDPRGTRFFRQSLDKMAECVDFMNSQDVRFLMTTGDFKDESAAPVEADTIRYLQTIEAAYQEFAGPTYHVLGNHDMDSIAKAQYLENVENTGIPNDRSYYSFDVGGVHFVALDACFTSDGADYDRGDFDLRDTNVSPTELDWLRSDLAGTSNPVVVFVHQLLDGEGAAFVNNSPDVRQALQDAGNVLAVFQGHVHTGGQSYIEGIHYYTLKAMVEGSGPDHSSYATVEIDLDRGITITGYRQAISASLDNEPA